MTGVTIKVLHGSDRGKVYEGLEPPLTVGREEGNDIQLNDERVSRCHLKIQRDNERLVLTDLDSTNGTKVNGVECQLKILRHGDLVAVGRSLAASSNFKQIAERLKAMGDGDGYTAKKEMSGNDASRALQLGEEPAAPYPAEALQIRELPGIPDDLTPGQKAQLCEILEFLQGRLHRLIETGEADEAKQEVKIKLPAWQRMLETQGKLAELIRRIADPDWPN